MIFIQLAPLVILTSFLTFVKHYEVFWGISSIFNLVPARPYDLEIYISFSNVMMYTSFTIRLFYGFEITG